MLTKENLNKIARIGLALVLGILTIAAANAANRRVYPQVIHTDEKDTRFTTEASYVDMEYLIDEVTKMRSRLDKTLNQLYKMLTLAFVGIGLLVISILVAVLCS
jgi:hypothetical protein